MINFGTLDQSLKLQRQIAKENRGKIKIKQEAQE